MYILLKLEAKSSSKKDIARIKNDKKLNNKKTQLSEFYYPNDW